MNQETLSEKIHMWTDYLGDGAYAYIYQEGDWFVLYETPLHCGEESPVAKFVDFEMAKAAIKLLT